MLKSWVKKKQKHLSALADLRTKLCWGALLLKRCHERNFYFAIIGRRNPPKIVLPCRARPCLEQFPPAVTNINQIQTKTANFPQDFRKWAETGKGKLLRKKLARLKHAKCAVQLRFVFHKKQRIQQKTKPWLAVVFFRE